MAAPRHPAQCCCCTRSTGGKAFLGAAALGLIAALPLLAISGGEPHTAPAKNQTTAASADWRVLLSAPILMNFVFFLIYAFGSFGVSNFSVVALGQLHGTSVATANSALTGYLLLTAAGVLIGGWMAGRITHHRFIAALGLGVTMLATFVVGEIDLGALMLVAVMSFSGLCSGMVMPSRDLIVREVTPPGSFGKVFAFVTTGYHIAGILAPLLFGALLDHGQPRSVFIVSAAFIALAIAAVACVPKRRAA